jgi:hypothetical protein
MPQAKTPKAPAAHKAATPAAAVQPARPKARAARKGPDASLRFYLSADLHGRLHGILAEIEQAEDAAEHHVELSETLVAAMNEGLDYYFVRTLKLAKAGFIIQQSANLGIVGVQSVMAPVIRKIVGRMEHEQLLSVTASIRELMK